MKFIATVLAASAVVASAADLAAQAAEVKLAKRDLTCSQVTDYALQAPAQATAFCGVYLQISPQTITQTATSTRATVTVSQPTYTTTILSVTPNGVTRELTETNTETTTFTPGTTTVTNTVTSTAYLNQVGSTITVMKRDATQVPGELAARAMGTPAWLRQMDRIAIRSACSCLDIPTPTYTVQKTAWATSTATKVLERKIIKTTTLGVVSETSTATVTRAITVTAPAPRETAVDYALATTDGCPPNTDTTWSCPDMTAADDGSDPNYENCGVVAQDGYAGYCLYWADDGSPAGSTLAKGDGSGNPANDLHREAVYGEASTDDCPSWANWSCPPSGGPGKRSSLVVASEKFEFTKRGYIPKRLSVAQHKRLGKAKMPKGLKRGGKYVPHNRTFAGKGKGAAVVSNGRTASSKGGK